MAAARHVLQADHSDYGVVCPECSSPKHRQSKRCASCYRDARRRGEYPDPPRLVGAANGRFKTSGHTGHRATGRPKGQPQPMSHPWRRRIARDVALAERKREAA